MPNKKKNNRNRRNNDRNTAVEETKTPTTNVNTRQQTLIHDAANLYFSNLVGTDISVVPGTKASIPGVTAFHGIQNFNTRSDMLNVAATSIYTFVRHANSGRANYESSDGMIYLLSMGEIYTGLISVIRAYGLASYYTKRNLYAPHVVRALGVDPIDLRNNLADYRYQINVLIDKVKSFAVPKTFNYFDELLDTYSRVYKDGQTEISQFYVVNKEWLGQFDATGESTGGSIKFAPFMKSEQSLPLSHYIGLLNETLDLLRRDEDSNIISGDMLKAYGEDLFKLEYIPSDFATEPVHDPVFLMQLQNASIMPDAVTPGSLIQSNNKLKHDSLVFANETGIETSNVFGGRQLLNLFIDEVDANIVFAANKYKVVVGSVTASQQTVSSAGPVVLSRPIVWLFDDTGEFNYDVLPTILGQNLVTYAGIMHTFNMYPITPIVGPTGIQEGLPFGEFYNVRVLEKADMERIHDLYFVLLFTTPQMG